METGKLTSYAKIAEISEDHDVVTLEKARALLAESSNHTSKGTNTLNISNGAGAFTDTAVEVNGTGTVILWNNNNTKDIDLSVGSVGKKWISSAVPGSGTDIANKTYVDGKDIILVNSIATKLDKNATLTFGGDVTGTGAANATSISIAVNDNSHNHITTNIVGLTDAINTSITNKLATRGLSQVLTVSKNGGHLGIDNIGTIYSNTTLDKSGIWQVEATSNNVVPTPNPNPTPTPGNGDIYFNIKNINVGVVDPQAPTKELMAGAYVQDGTHLNQPRYRRTTYESIQDPASPGTFANKTWWILYTGWFWLVTYASGTDGAGIWDKSAFQGNAGVVDANGHPTPIGFLTPTNWGEYHYTGDYKKISLVNETNQENLTTIQLSIDSISAMGSIYSNTYLKTKSAIKIGGTSSLDAIANNAPNTLAEQLQLTGQLIGQAVETPIDPKHYVQKHYIDNIDNTFPPQRWNLSSYTDLSADTPWLKFVQSKTTESGPISFTMIFYQNDNNADPIAVADITTVGIESVLSPSIRYVTKTQIKSGTVQIGAVGGNNEVNLYFKVLKRDLLVSSNHVLILGNKTNKILTDVNPFIPIVVYNQTPQVVIPEKIEFVKDFKFKTYSAGTVGGYDPVDDHDFVTKGYAATHFGAAATNLNSVISGGNITNKTARFVYRNKQTLTDISGISPELEIGAHPSTVQDTPIKVDAPAIIFRDAYQKPVIAIVPTAAAEPGFEGISGQKQASNIISDNMERMSLLDGSSYSVKTANCFAIFSGAIIPSAFVDDHTSSFQGSINIDAKNRMIRFGARLLGSDNLSVTTLRMHAADADFAEGGINIEGNGYYSGNIGHNKSLVNKEWVQGEIGGFQSTVMNIVVPVQMAVASNTTKINNINSAFSKSVTIASPKVTDDPTLFYTTKPITLLGTHSVIKGSGIVKYNIVFATVRDSAVTNTLYHPGVEPGADNTTGRHWIVSAMPPADIKDTAVTAGSWVWVDIVSVTGTVDEFHLTLDYGVI